MQPFPTVTVPLLESRRCVRDCASVHDAESRGLGEIGSDKIGIWAFLRPVLFDVPVGGRERLPDSGEVGLAIAIVDRLVAVWSLGAERCGAKQNCNRKGTDADPSIFRSPQRRRECAFNKKTRSNF